MSSTGAAARKWFTTVSNRGPRLQDHIFMGQTDPGRPPTPSPPAGDGARAERYDRGATFVARCPRARLLRRADRAGIGGRVYNSACPSATLLLGKKAADSNIAQGRLGPGRIHIDAAHRLSEAGGSGCVAERAELRPSASRGGADRPLETDSRIVGIMIERRGYHHQSLRSHDGQCRQQGARQESSR